MSLYPIEPVTMLSLIPMVVIAVMLAVAVFYVVFLNLRESIGVYITKIDAALTFLAVAMLSAETFILGMYVYAFFRT